MNIDDNWVSEIRGSSCEEKQDSQCVVTTLERMMIILGSDIMHTQQGSLFE